MSKTNRVKSFFRNCPLTRKTWIRLSDARLRRIKSRELMENGEDTVVRVQKILSETGVFFFFDMGTLLGIVREGRLLKHDMDIDIGVRLKDEEEIKALRETLISKGCVLNIDAVEWTRRELTGPCRVGFTGSSKQAYVSRLYYRPFREKLEETRRIAK